MYVVGVFRVTATTNLYISGLLYHGASHDFLDLARAGYLRLAVIDDILDDGVFQRPVQHPLQEALKKKQLIETSHARFILRRPSMTKSLSNPRR